jgi:hypothetical protein
MHGTERSGAGRGRGLRAGDAGENLSVRRWQGGELDRGNNVATWGTRVCQHMLPRHAKGRLHPSLDDALSASAARPVKRAARGPRLQAVGTGIRPVQRRQE